MPWQERKIYKLQPRVNLGFLIINLSIFCSQNQVNVVYHSNATEHSFVSCLWVRRRRAARGNEQQAGLILPFQILE